MTSTSSEEDEAFQVAVVGVEQVNPNLPTDSLRRIDVFLNHTRFLPILN